MSRSVRIDAELERRLEKAAEVEGKSVSAIIRDAVSRRCDEVLGHRTDVELADVIGAVDVPSDWAQDTGKAFTDLVAVRRGT